MNPGQVGLSQVGRVDSGAELERGRVDSLPKSRAAVRSLAYLKLTQGGGRLLVCSVPMREQKNDEKGYFFSKLDSAQRCPYLG